MKIYAEIVFLDNLFIDFFIFLFTLKLSKRNVSLKRLAAVSVITAITSCIMPFIGKYTVLMKILSIIIIPFLIVKSRVFMDYVRVLITFLTVSLFFAGAVYFLCDFIGISSIKIYYGYFPVLFSIVGIIGVYTVSILKKERLTSITDGDNYTVSMIINGKRRTYDALLDNGNFVFAKNGEGVSFVTSKIYNIVDEPEENVFINTVKGVSNVNIKHTDMEIYSRGGAHIYYTGYIASMNYGSKYDVILNRTAVSGDFNERVFQENISKN